MITRLPMLGIAAAAFISGCGASALPVTQMAPPREAIRATEELGGDQNPRASLHLKFARDQVARADRLLKDGDEQGAQLALMSANADAKLALEITREEKTRAEAQQAQQKITELLTKTATP